MMPVEQEPDQVPRGLVRISAIAIAISVAASVGAVVLLGGRNLGETMRVDSAPPPRIDILPFELETDPERERRAARERLERYGWVDRQRRIIHVPIEVAIESYLAERRP